MTAVPYTCTPSLDPINSLSIPSFVSSISLPATSHFQSSSSHYHPSISSSPYRLSSYCYPSNKVRSSPYNKYGKVNEPAPIPISEVSNEDDQQKTNESNELSEEESIECVDKEKQLQNLVQNIRSQIPSPTPPSSAAIFESMQSKNRAMLSMIGPANAIRQQEERCMSDVATQIQTFLNRYKVESKMYSVRGAPSVQKDRDINEFISVHPPSNAGHAASKNELEQKFRRSIRSTKVAETKSDERNRSTDNTPIIGDPSSQQRSSDGVTLGSVASAPLWARRQSSKGDAPIDAVNESSTSVFNAFPTSLSSINSLAASPLAFPTNNNLTQNQ